MEDDMLPSLELSSVVPELIPALTQLPGKQVHFATRAGCFHQGIELVWFSGMLAANGFQGGRMVAVQKDGLAAGPKQAVLGLSSEPIARAHAVFDPGEECLVFKAPSGDHFKGNRQMGVGGPQPKRSEE